MSTLHFTKRAQDRLDLSLIVEFYLSKITSACKGAVAHAVSGKIGRLITAKSELEMTLETLADKARSFLGKLRTRGEIKRIKREIVAINSRMVEWLNMVYTYFLSR